MKHTKAMALLLTVVLLIGSIIPTGTVFAAGEASTDGRSSTTGTKGYWSDTNAPEFYGTTKIVLKKGTSFSLDDTRYRIFARDFEDFDLTHEIQTKHDVNTEVAGEYSIHYSVTDRHGNQAKLTVPVTVTEDGSPCMVERTMYSLPSVDNIAAMGIGRGDNHDRQMLGIFVKAEATVRIRKVSGSKNLAYTMLSNDSRKEASKTITNEWQTITHNNDYTPFIKTLYKENEPVKVEIEWEEEETGVRELNYYHDGDDEDAFFSNWESDTDAYAVIEGEAVTVLVPYADRNKLINHWRKCFHSLDEFLNFWKQTTDAYDDMLGLEYAPEDVNDQNVKSRFFVRANANGAGAAYYAGDHVGVNNASVASFFEVNWGGLHEFGHGYQGTLGKGDLNIGEVSNNIFGHYVQMNRDIYPYNEDWLGKLPNIEEKYNQMHQQGKNFLDLDVVGKLYFVINFLDSFEGPDTYKAIAKLYRKNVIAKNNMSSQDAWVLGIYDAHGVNLTNYFESWGIPVSDTVKAQLQKANSKNAFAMKDLVGSDEIANQIKSELGLDAKYQLVTSEQLAAFGLKGNVTVQFAIDDIANIEGRYVYLMEGNKKVARKKIEDTSVIFSDVPVGSYTISAPELIASYAKKETSVTVSNDQTAEATITYTKEGNAFANDVMIQFEGLYYKDAAQVTLNKEEDGLNLQFRYRGTTLFNGGLAADYEYAKIQVLDEEGNECYLKKVGGAKEMFSKVNVETFDLAVKEGYKIILKYHNATDKLRFISTLNGDERKAYEIPNKEEAVYIITKDGLQKESFTEDEFYEERKERAVTYLDTMLSELGEEERYDKTVYAQKKAQIIYAYETLKSEDQKAYTSIINKMVNGHSPVLTLKKNEYQIMIGEKVELSSLVSASDQEDGEIPTEEIQITTDLENNKIGSYTATFLVTDSDRNSTTASMKINVVDYPDIMLNKVKATIYTKTTLSLKATGMAPGKVVSWKSSNTKVATVDKNGKVAAKKAGSVKITATVDGKSASCMVTVKKAETKLSASTLILTTAKTKTKTLTATVNGVKTKGKDLSWKSSNDKVAKVDKNGKVTAKKSGVTTITATGKNGVKATCKVIVNPTLTLKKQSATLKVKGTVKIQAVVTPAASAISYESSNEKIATVSKTGTVKAKKKGKATITVTANDVKKKFTVTVK